MMEHLDAPWRNSYITSQASSDDCVLCSIGRDEDSDGRNFVLYRMKGLFVVLNRFPYINGHLMIVPRDHVPDLSALERKQRHDLMDLMVMCERALWKGMGCTGINGGWNLGSCAGAGIPGHVHVHMLPRWSGDTNFITTVGETRVLSASLEDSYEKLRPFFAGGGE